MLTVDKTKLFHDGDKILSITQPESLFSSASECKNEYRLLATMWHPDRNKDVKASQIFSHINSLYELAVEKFNKGTWTNINFPFHRQFSFELGEAYIGDDHITYLVDVKHKEYVDNFSRTCKKFKFASDRMEKEVTRYLPLDVSVEKQDDKYRVTVPKARDLVRLRDVLDHFGGSLDPKHVAWIESSLYNLCCYLNFASLVHSDISLDTYFIAPESHSGALLGGWWYSTSFGSSLTSVPRRTFGLLPTEVLNTKRAHVSIDLELVRAVGRDLLRGDLSKAPDAMQTWLKSLAGDDPVIEYEQWGDVLKESFGARRFTPMNVSAIDIYK